MPCRVESRRAEALLELLPCLNDATARQKAVQEVQSVLMGTGNTERLVRPPLRLFPYLSDHEKNQVLKQATDVMSVIRDKDEQTRAVAKLASTQSQSLLRTTFEAAQTIRDDSLKVETLTILAPKLATSGCQQEALAAIEELRGTSNFEETLTRVMPTMTRELLQSRLASLVYGDKWGPHATVLMRLGTRLPSRLLALGLIAVVGVTWDEAALQQRLTFLDSLARDWV